MSNPWGGRLVSADELLTAVRSEVSPGARLARAVTDLQLESRLSRARAMLDMALYAVADAFVSLESDEWQ